MRLTIVALSAALSIPFAAAYSAPSSPSALSAAAGHMRHGLTPEEHFLYMKQLRGADWRKLPIAQRCERAKKLRQERRAMSPAQKQNLKQQLDAQWSKLPAAEKQRIEQRIARHEAKKAEGKGPHNHGRRCAEPDPAD
jgi:hypothetical protein